ncbi:MAG: phosphatase PAP2 family protein, partial [Actinomycetota bacterium]|nr:phosphatase PAP2 family protein [Actinomycetota bacterium]
VWDAKFAYWNPRPENAIRDLGLDRNWKPYLPTPFFPAYASGSAGYAGGVETIMIYLFPDRAEEFKRRAAEQAESRLYAGIHWRYDAVSREAGNKISELVIERVKDDSVGRHT